MNKTLSVAVITLAIGGALGYFAATTFSQHNGAQETTTSSEKQPLYWVAPMDPNYQRDKPGKSPMGMDLIPFYEEEQNGGKKDPTGTVFITPAVENNLGVKTTSVINDKLTPKIDTVGYIAFDESQLWQINSRVSGWIQKLNINAIGEKVQKGDVLFTLYSSELVRAQEELLNAKRIGKAVLVQGAKERLAALGVDNNQINAVLRNRKSVKNIAIKAPADGIITNLNVRTGAYISPAQSVISGGSLDNIWVDAEVFERQSNWVQSGTAADMTLGALPGKHWQGKIDYVYPILNPNTRTLRVRLKFPNTNGDLKPNMFANITLMPQSNNKVLLVPNQAVIRSAGMSRVVLALGDGKFRSIRVETGRESGSQIEIIKGLNPNDTIVTSSHFLLDSESSLSADLSRISNRNETQTAVSAPVHDMASHSTTQSTDDPTDNLAWTTGVIRNVMLDHKMLTIQHSPIPAWQWPAMQMDFMVKDDVDMNQFVAGQSIRFLIEKTAKGQYVVADVDQVNTDNNTSNNNAEVAQ